MKRWLKICAVLVAIALVHPALWYWWPVDGDIASNTRHTQYLDMHVHVAGIGAGGSGCFVNQAMRDNLRFDYFLHAMG